MWRKIIISVLIVAILLIASCVYLSNPPSVDRPGITSDSSDGAIVIYEVYKILRKHDFYVQRIGPEGDFLWGEKGILIGSGYKNGGGIFDLHAVGDGSGGAIVIWRSHPQRRPLEYVNHATRVDSEGNIQWRRDVPSIEEAIADGSGGVIITFSEFDERPCILKIDSEGNFPWGKDGVSLSLRGYASCRDIASDNLGGAIIVQDIAKEHIISAQRVDSEGNILWQRGGVQVFVGPAESPQVAGDGSGGAIITYMRNIPCEDGIGSCGSDIYAQGVDAEGNILWAPDGVPVRIGPPNPCSPKIVADGAGSAIIFFEEYLSIYAQRLDANGYKLWPEDDIQVWKGGGHASPYWSVVSDGFGGAIIKWCGGEEREERAQRLDAMGRKLWGLNGTLVSSSRGRRSLPAISEDGCGGAFISWTASKFIGDAILSYVQRTDAQGNCLWGEKGILLNR